MDLLKQPWAGPGEMAQHVRSLAAFVKDLGLVPSTQVEVHSCLQPSSDITDTLFWPPKAQGTHTVYINAGKTYIHIKCIIFIRTGITQAFPLPILFP